MLTPVTIERHRWWAAARLFGKRKSNEPMSAAAKTEGKPLPPSTENRMLSSRARVAVAALLFGVGLALFVATTVLSLANHFGFLSSAQRSFLVGTI